MRTTTTTTIVREVGDEEHEIEIEAKYYTGTNQTYDHPGDPEDVEILSAFIGKEEVELTEAEEEQAKQQILEDPPEPSYDEE